MLNPKIAGINEVVNEAENLNILLEVIISNKEINNTQRDVLLGLALNASSNLLFWCETEEKRCEECN